MEWRSAIAATALNSIRPVLNLSSATLACCVLISCCRSNEVLRRTYGKDNRVLHTAKPSQGFKVVPPSRTWQGAGISTFGTKIGVTGSETRTAKLRLQGEATIMSKQKSCGVVVACSLLARIMHEALRGPGVGVKVGCDPTRWDWSSERIAEFPDPDVRMQDRRDKKRQGCRNGC